MIKIVQGNDFYLRVLLTEESIDISSAQQIALHLVSSFGKVVELTPHVIDVHEIKARVEGELACGIYGVEITGKLNDDDFRSFEVGQIEIVYTNAQADHTPTDVLSIETYELEMSISVGGGSQVQADWEQEDESAPSYIKNKPTIYNKNEVDTKINKVYAELDQNFVYGWGWQVFDKLHSERIILDSGFKRLLNSELLDAMRDAINEKMGYAILAGDTLIFYRDSNMQVEIARVNLSSLFANVAYKSQVYTKQQMNELLADKVDVIAFDSAMDGKVDKESGKGLSSQDFTTALKTKLSQLPTNTELTNLLNGKADVSDVEALETAVGNKADKAGVMFNPAQSTFADNSKEFLFYYYDASQAGGASIMRVIIPAPQVQADWAEASSLSRSYIANKPTIYTQAEVDELLAANGLRQLFLRSDFRSDSDPNKCRYNSDTGYYEMNGISDLTEDDMWKIYRVGEPPYQAERFLNSAGSWGAVDMRIRTTFPTTRTNLQSTSRYGENQSLLEVLCLNPLGSFVITQSSGNPLLVNATVLHTIIGRIDCVSVVANATLFQNCPMLKNVQIYKVNKNITVTAPKISYDSMAYMVTQATNTAAITIKVAPETYSYLTGTATPPEDVGGTSEQWQELAATATDKQIAFAQ